LYRPRPDFGCPIKTGEFINKGHWVIPLAFFIFSCCERDTEMADYYDYKRDQDRWFAELEQEERRVEAAAARKQERRRLEQVDKQIDQLWPETVQLGQLAGMSGLRAAAWAFEMVRGAKQLTRQPRRVC
jgi:hypothetical protein